MKTIETWIVSVVFLIHNIIFILITSLGGIIIKDFEANLGMIKGQLLLYPTVHMANVEDEYEMSTKHKSAIEFMLAMFNGPIGGLKSILSTSDVKNGLNHAYGDNVGVYPKVKIVQLKLEILFRNIVNKISFLFSVTYLLPV